MKVLITGSNGFIGSKLVSVFKAANHNVMTLAKSNADYSCDLTIDQPNLDRDFDLIIHCAGIAHNYHLSDEEVLQAYALSTKNLLSALQTQIKLNSFIYLSSVSVYGLEQGDLIDELQLPLPKSAYGKGKLLAESLFQEWANDQSINLCILRLPLVYAENAPGNLAKMRKAINKRYFALIGGGSAKKSIVHLDDLSSFILTLNGVKGVYHLTDGCHPTFKDIAVVMSKSKFIFNLPLKLAKYVAKIGDRLGSRFPINSKSFQNMTSTLTFSDDKARKELGWKSNCVVNHE